MILRGGDIELDIPLFCSEILLKRYIAFKRKRQKWLGVLIRDSFTEEESAELRDALLEVVDTMVDGNLQAVPFYISPDKDFHTIGLDYKGPLSLYHIYHHLLNMIDSYKVDEGIGYSFEWFDDGKPTVFFIEPDRAKRLLLSKHYTVGEHIELQEYDRKVSRKIRSNAGGDAETIAMEYIGDKNGNLAFTLSKRQLAILARPDGEILPSNKTERENLIKRRMKTFDDITLDIYLNVRFFLLSIVGGWNLRQITGDSTNPSRSLFTVMGGTGKHTRKQSG